MPKYYSGRGGEPLSEVTIHNDEDCSELVDADGSARPIADVTIEATNDLSYCGECTDRPTLAEQDIAGLVEMGECPWCGSDFENIASHASQSHKEAWNAYKDR